MVSVLNKPMAAALTATVLVAALAAPGIASAHNTAHCPTAAKASVHTVKTKPRVKTVKVKVVKAAPPCACAVRTVVKYVTVPDRRPPEQVVVYRAPPRVWYPQPRERIVAEAPVQVPFRVVYEDRIRVVHHYDYDSVPRHHHWQRYPDWIEHP